MSGRLLSVGICVFGWLSLQGQTVSVGSKIFPESRLLAEIMSQTIEARTDLKVERRFNLGGTLICYEALRTGEIDLYPEYTGTITTTLLHRGRGNATLKTSDVDSLGLALGPAFGFNNSYAIAVRKDLNIRTISELEGRNDLNYGFSNEFLKRPDGFEALNAFYHLGLNRVRGMDHGLAYRALAEGRIDATDAYTTDGKLNTYHFVLLRDDRGFFPGYRALPLMRDDLEARHPEVFKALESLRGAIGDSTMRSMNHAVEVDGMPVAKVAADFLAGLGVVAPSASAPASPFWRQTREHVRLTLLSTLMAVLIGIPLGIFITYRPRWSRGVISATGVLQTIPSLALLGFMIPLFGIGFLPAVIALFLYALLPIVRNTHTGLKGTDPLLVEAAKAMGMRRMQILLQIRLPLAAAVIMAGVRTALTINIGTATLAAFIGAGGYGESIITGITLNDNSIILRGAVPAAILALLADGLMGKVEKTVRAKGLEEGE